MLLAGGRALSDDCPSMLAFSFIVCGFTFSSFFGLSKDDLSAFGSRWSVGHCCIFLVEHGDDQAVGDVKTSLP